MPLLVALFFSTQQGGYTPLVVLFVLQRNKEGQPSPCVVVSFSQRQRRHGHPLPVSTPRHFGWVFKVCPIFFSFKSFLLTQVLAATTRQTRKTGVFVSSSVVVEGLDSYMPFNGPLKLVYLWVLYL